MSERKWWYLTFSKKTKRSRKALATFLLVLVVLGYLAFFALNAYIIASTAFIRIYPQGFSDAYDPVTNTTGISGTFTVDNSHWNSIDITEFEFDYILFAENGTEIIDNDNTPINIPRQQMTNITIDLTFNLTEMTEEKALALNNSDYLIFDVTLSFKYFLYGFYVNVELNTSLLE